MHFWLFTTVHALELRKVGVGLDGAEEDELVLYSEQTMQTSNCKQVNGQRARGAREEGGAGPQRRTWWFMPVLVKRSVGSSYGMVKDSE